MSEEHSVNFTIQLWGFVAAVVSGSAETMFNRADRAVGEMNGIDAWRRLTRHIDHGLALRLDDMRHEMGMPHFKPIKALPHVRTCYVEIPREIFGQPVDFFAHHSGLTLVGFQDTHVCVLGLVCYGLTKTKTNLNSCTKSLI